MSGKTARKKRQENKGRMGNSKMNDLKMGEIDRLIGNDPTATPVIVSRSPLMAVEDAAKIGLSPEISAEIGAIFDSEGGYCGPNLLIAVRRISEDTVAVGKAFSPEGENTMVGFEFHGFYQLTASSSANTAFEKMDRPVFFTLTNAETEFVEEVAPFYAGMFDYQLKTYLDSQQTKTAA